jgi:hypothetical protein
MSLINDALNKVQRQRGEKLTVDALSRYGSTPHVAAPKPAGRIPAALWVLINAGVLVVVLGGYHYFFRNAAATDRADAPLSRSSSARPVRVAATPDASDSRAPVSRISEPSPTVASTELRVTRDTSVATNSGVQAAPETAYDLAGMTVVGKGTLLSIIRRSDQRSFWVPIGKTVGEVTAISYDADNDSAVIRVRGEFITIRMRDGSVVFTPITPQK